MHETIKSTDSLIKESIHHFFEENGIKNPNKKHYGNALSEFYMWEIGQHIFKIYDDDIKDGLECDGKGDLNIDFAHHYIEDNSFLIIQSKYKGNNSSVDIDELSGFFNIHERITDKTYLNKFGNSAVKSELADINENSSFNYVFLTNDKFTDRLIVGFPEVRPVRLELTNKESVNFKPLIHEKAIYRKPDCWSYQEAGSRYSG